MGLIDRALAYFQPQRSISPGFDWDPFANILNFNGITYPLGLPQQTLQGTVEDIGGGFDSLVQAAYQTNPIVFACELARISLFSEARFQYQRLVKGRPGDLYGLPSLDILEHPWPLGNTSDLLTRALLDADFGGTAFHTRRTRTTIRRLRPDWVTMLLGSNSDPEVSGGDIDADVLGVIYYPGGKTSGRPPEFIQRSEVSIFAPIPDPLASYRGMPWVMPVIREILADKQMTEHKSAYLLNGATPNLTVAIDKDLKEAANPKAFMEWIEAFKKTNPTTNAWEKYSTWYLAGGTTVTKVGSDLQEVDFKQVQGAGETRIAAAAGVPPVIAGFSEGLQAATYSNYGQARRRFADGTMRPLWRMFAGALEDIVPAPPGSRLWYDDRDIPFLRDDKKDEAEIYGKEAQIIRTLVDAGFEPQTVTAAASTGDWSVLQHTGLYSVQLQPPQPNGPPTPEPTPEPEPPKRETALLQLIEASQRRADHRPDPVINIHQAPVTVHTPEQPVSVNIERGAVEVSSPVTVEPSVVNVTTPEVRNEITVEPTPVEITNEVSVEPTPVSITNDVSVEPTPVEITNEVSVEPTPVVVTNEAPEQRAVKKTIVRDKGVITEIREEPIDG